MGHENDVRNIRMFNVVVCCSRVMKATSTFLFKLTSIKAFNNARQVLNRPTSHTFINGLKYNDTNKSKFSEELRTAKTFLAVQGLCIDVVIVIRPRQLNSISTEFLSFVK